MVAEVKTHTVAMIDSHFFVGVIAVEWLKYFRVFALLYANTWVGNSAGKVALLVIVRIVDLNADCAQILAVLYRIEQQDHKHLLHSILVHKQLRHGDCLVCQH